MRFDHSPNVDRTEPSKSGCALSGGIDVVPGLIKGNKAGDISLSGIGDGEPGCAAEKPSHGRWPALWVGLGSVGGSPTFEPELQMLGLPPSNGSGYQPGELSLRRCVHALKDFEPRE